jgi:hypothetical protein
MLAGAAFCISVAIGCNSSHVRTSGNELSETMAVSSFEYLGSDHQVHTASINPTDVSNPGTPLQSTIDPSWHVVQGSMSGDFGELKYITFDGTEWWAKVRCTYILGPYGPYIYCRFEHKRPDGTGGHDDVGINFLDGQGRRWHAELLRVVRPFPASPQFVITPAS